ncbi:selenocysteine-specific translation elongation factor [Helicobacter anatolicus]|uniref:selenocysteine-specific translation elongation factor n=1 Tax=Helicobacter anatolicus TaxID=2905874 RepID=UPI001E3E414C|nr:selenocysteine-specific translation elongation factor [Helicobacter anatolicus]MCE3040228.1 selenocysteine-specific translation elongation factor [Helicobacter anatolicus]
MDNDIIVGLGGHIDHGKTSLIKALNGFDGDESLQEKERGITLDISFSELKLPRRRVAFIDVPGHHKLVKNMIAGAFGIDVLLLVVASDDGIMPQTIEHLEIANFLGIQKAICVITKCDLVRDSTHLESLKKEIEQVFATFKNISLERILDFSIYNKSSQEKILTILDSIIKPQKSDKGFFRYYIDRSFSLKGIGSVVSGSVVSGSIEVGQKIFICELQKEVSVRSLQMHNQQIRQAFPSHRVAINLSGINSAELQRGFLLTQKGFMRGFDRIDVILYGLSDENIHNKTLYFFIGAKKCRARVVILKQDSKGSFATLCLEEKIFAIFKECFILRDETSNVAGGKVLNPITDPIKKSQKILLLEALLQEDFATAFYEITQAHKRGFGLISATQRFGLTHEDALEIARDIKDAFLDSRNLVLYHQESLALIEKEVLQIFTKNPLALLSAKSLALKIVWASEWVLDHILNQLLEQGKIEKNNGLFIAKDNKIKDLQAYVSDKIFTLLLQEGKTPQAPYNLYDSLDIDREIGDRAFKKLCAAQKVVRLQHNLFIPSVILQNIVTSLRDLIQKYGYVDLMVLKQEWGISRKYLIAYLDYLDRFDDIINQEGRRMLRYA